MKGELRVSKGSIDLLIDWLIDWQADLEDHSNELKMAEDNAKKAMADATRLAEEVRHEQEHSSSIEKLRRTLESQVKELQVSHSATLLRSIGPTTV